MMRSGISRASYHGDASFASLLASSSSLLSSSSSSLGRIGNSPVSSLGNGAISSSQQSHYYHTSSSNINIYQNNVTFATNGTNSTQCRHYGTNPTNNNPPFYRQQDITQQSFPSTYHTFTSHLHHPNTHFISLDFEFTGLFLGSSRESRSVFGEDFERRYEKLRKAVKRFAPLQVGICIWERVPSSSSSGASVKASGDSATAASDNAKDTEMTSSSSYASLLDAPLNDSNNNNSSSTSTSSSNNNTSNPPNTSQNLSFSHIDTVTIGSSTYIARSFNFNIFPKYSKVFLVESSALQFLVNNQFDFNKVFRDGVPFLNEIQIAKKRQEIEAYGRPDSLQKYSITKDHSAFDAIQAYLEQVQQFRSIAAVGQTKMLPVERFFHLRLLEQEIFKRFNDVFPEIDKERERMVLHFVNEESREQLLQKIREEKLQKLEEKCGMTRIIRQISEKQVPIVCHNGMYDLLYLYHHFVRPLPLTSGEYKKQLHESFPTIFDTKYIACHSKEVQALLGTVKPETLNLGALYQFVTQNLTSQRRDVAVRVPQDFGNCANREVAHEAGYDAFMTGTVWLRLMNRVCGESPRELRASLQEHKLRNRVAVSSADYCMALD